MGDLLEEMILQRLQGHMVRESGLSENQFGFRKGRSTVDAIQAVVYIVTKARIGTDERKGFCALISIDIRNAFNTVRWDLPAVTSIIGFADDALVCAADDVRILELRINESVWRAKCWLDSWCLKMIPEKTEPLLVTDRRSFQYPKIVFGEHEIEWEKIIKYLRVQLARRLSFGEHLQIATAKLIQFFSFLTIPMIIHIDKVLLTSAESKHFLFTYQLVTHYLLMWVHRNAKMDDF